MSTYLFTCGAPFGHPRASVMEPTKPGKEKVREYMERRQVERRQSSRPPVHGPEQIRHEIGWDMVDRRQQGRRNDDR